MNSIISHTAILTFFLLGFVSSSFGQDDDEKINVILDLKGKNRTDKLQISDKIILPEGDITGFGIYALDTMRYSYKQKEFTDPKKIKELIRLLEDGTITNDPFDWQDGVSLSLNYKNNKNYDIWTSGNKIHFTDYDTTVILTNAEPFIKEIQKLADWKPFDPGNLIHADKVVLTYKNNKRTITDQKLINELLECLKYGKPTSSTKCPFYNSRIYIHTGNEIISAAPAHDGCNIIIIEKNYFELNGDQCGRFFQILKEQVGFETGL